MVNDGSKDATAEIVREEFAKAGSVATQLLEHFPNRGKGAATRIGLLAAARPIALFSDADLSTPIDEAPKLIEPIAAGEIDVAVGSRALDRTLIGVHQPWKREQGGRIFNLIVRVATGLPFWDTQCGFKAFRLDVCRPILEQAEDRWIRFRRRITLPGASCWVENAGDCGSMESQRWQQGQLLPGQLAYVQGSRGVDGRGWGPKCNSAFFPASWNCTTLGLIAAGRCRTPRRGRRIQTPPIFRLRCGVRRCSAAFP